MDIELDSIETYKLDVESDSKGTKKNLIWNLNRFKQINWLWNQILDGESDLKDLDVLSNLKQITELDMKSDAIATN